MKGHGMRSLRDIAVFALAALAAGCVGWEPIEAGPEPGPENQVPRIEIVDPASRLMQMRMNESWTFRVVSVSDFENDDVYYQWRLNGNLISNGTLYQYLAFQIGTHQLDVIVWDCEPTLGTESYQACQNEPPPGKRVDTFGWTIEVSP